MRLSKKALKILREDVALQGKLAAHTEKSWRTIERWLDENHEFLTTASVLHFLKNETGLSEEELLTDNTPANK